MGFKKFPIILIIIFFLFNFKEVVHISLFRFPKKVENLYNPLTKEGTELGRYLFYDPILSKDSSFSCSSCHKQEYAFADNTKFSFGVNGAKMNRNTLPLFNLEWYSKFFWDGRTKSIENQVLIPVSAHNEMNLSWQEAEKRINKNLFYKEKFNIVFGNVKIDSTLITKAIGQFERTLISDNSKYDRVIQGNGQFTESELNGFVLMNDQSIGDCLQCHITDAHALGTNSGFANNGLDNDIVIKDLGMYKITKKQTDIGKFKVPSLRNIALTAPYMHDGRFQKLEEVLDFYSEGVQSSSHIDSKMQYAHKGGVKLTEKEKENIIAFLNTLTDSTFINNINYSNPYK